jgi:hypothetical protein
MARYAVQSLWTTPALLTSCNTSTYVATATPLGDVSFYAWWRRAAAFSRISWINREGRDMLQMRGERALGIHRG